MLSGSALMAFYQNWNTIEQNAQPLESEVGDL